MLQFWSEQLNLENVWDILVSGNWSYSSFGFSFTLSGN